MYGRERRRSGVLDTDALREGLTPAQLDALATLEHFQWTLRFVRRPMFHDLSQSCFTATASVTWCWSRTAR
jgi:hypothetical protein